MYLERVPASRKKTRRQTVRFGGLNYTRDYRDGDLADCLGMSGEAYPCLGQRLGRRQVSGTNWSTGLFAFDKLVTVRNGGLYYGNDRVGSIRGGEKQYAVVGDKLCIFPDKKYLELTTGELKDLGAKALLADHSVRFTPNGLTIQEPWAVLGAWTYRLNGSRSYVDGFRYKVFAGEDLRWDPDTGWDRSMPFVEKDVYALQQGDCIMFPRSPDRGDRDPDYSHPGYDDYAGQWDSWGDFAYVTGTEWEREGSSAWARVNLERRCAAIRNPDLTASGFRVGDTVRVSGCVTAPENNRDMQVREIRPDGLVFDVSDLTTGVELGVMTVERKIPDLDFICAAEGRLFGVNNAEKAIYISALGDPRNFYDYRGLEESGARLAVATEGDFTGCIAYSGKVLFFKEDCLHRLMGDRPGRYAVYTDQVAGLQAGSHRSLQIINEVLYYKSRDGVYAYTGSTPKPVSGALGNVLYEKAAAGSDGRRYYISMRRMDTGAWELLSYDTRTGLWFKEDQTAAKAFAFLDGTLYMQTARAVFALGQSKNDPEDPLAWEVTFTPFDEGVMERKYPSRLLLRLELEPGAWAEAQLARDGGAFQTVWTAPGGAAGPTAVIPLRPGRCDSYQLRLRGEGRCLLRSLAREFSLGGVR